MDSLKLVKLSSIFSHQDTTVPCSVFAIALTTLLSTSMFTIVLSLNASYETYRFRQAGGYAHGTFKDVSTEQVDTDLGYTWDSYTDPNSVRIGVNWGYTSSQLESQLDPELMIAIAAFLLLVIFTGYLIIYNIFQISVVGDIRFYGLLKTIGTTPLQLKRIIRQQALLLCLIGIPVGLLPGYGIGAVLVPVVLRSTQLDAGITTISTSPVIFLGYLLCFRL